MDVVDEKPKMIYKNEINGKPKYQIGVSKKKEDGEYENGYVPCRFKKDVELENKTRIKMKQAWIDFYRIDNKTYPYIFINDFDIVEQQEQQQKTTEKWSAGRDIEIDEDELPFY